MASATTTRNPFSALLARKGVSVLADNPVPREAVSAIVMGRLFFCEIRHTVAGHTAVFHFRDGEWLNLTAAPGTLFAATAAISDFLDRVWDLPPGWSQQRDDAIRAAAAAVLAGPAPALPLAA